MLPVMLILGLILFGMLVGAGAQLILGKSAKRVDWTLALVAGLVGSFVGGLLIKEWKVRGRINSSSFLIRRGFKIWPQYYVFLMALLLTGHRSSPLVQVFPQWERR